MKKNKIAFVLAVHLPDDDRVWYQQSQALLERGHEVFIVSATSGPLDKKDVFCFEKNISHLQQINKFSQYLSIINPDVVICDNPVSVFGASKYKKKNKKRQLKIYYDITEWYPSKKNLYNHLSLIKFFKTIILSFISLITPFFLSGFIFGEYYKSLPFRTLFPFKKHIYLPYYADTKHITSLPIRNISKKCVLLYSGQATAEKGFDTFINAAIKCAEKLPDTRFILRLICEPKTDLKISENLQNIEINHSKYLAFVDFCKEISEADIFFDLRSIDIENTRCLPIKLFYYMAAGRPVVYSNLKAIRKGVPEINDFGFLVNPQNIDEIVEKISQYIGNKELYQKHCVKARELAETKYNWESIKNQFIEFVEK